MRVLVAVPAYRVARVREVAPPGCAVATVVHLDQIDTAMHASPADVVVLDPLLDVLPNEPLLLQTVRNHPCARWLLYTQLRPDSARLLLALGGAGVRCAVFAGVDDSAQRVGGLQNAPTPEIAISALLDPPASRLRHGQAADPSAARTALR